VSEDYGGVDPEESKRRRASHRKNSAEILRAHGVPFELKSGGVHLVIGEPPFADFWPGTGLWISRGGRIRGRGVFNLLKVIGAKPPARA
jgi:hypothetical protein